MPTPTFQRLSPEQFEQLLQKFPFTRKIDAVHMHHTRRPRHADFRGHDTIVSMWRHHTQVNGWSDIAQHLTIDPDGMVWLGRNWNLPPASAAGHNGNKAFGPFMFEMIGDFDTGRDPFGGAQKDTVLRVVALVQSRFHLPADTLRFHNAMSSKSCPGSALAYADILAEVEDIRQEMQAGASRGPAQPQPFPEETDRFLAEAIRSLSRTLDNAGEPGDAELSHDEQEAGQAAASRPGAAGNAGDLSAPAQGRDSGLGTAALNAMRPHLVNLRVGRLSGEGEAASTPGDIDALFEQHLPQAISELPAGHKLRLVFYAHGGLVSESSGLQIAHKHIGWWRSNAIYPIYFIWETGFFETIGQLLGRAQQGSRALARDLADFTTDPLVEIGARALQGPRIWGGMKSSAEHAMDAPAAGGDIGGGAHYVATKLKALCDGHADRIELHAVGHSAGSIFHSHFLPLAHALGVPGFRTVHFLAPAVRVDTFRQRLLEHIGPGRAAESLTLYTMRRDFERKDNCAQIYRKSLLYLIFNALEDRRGTPILGLEESLRGDADLKRLFGLAGAQQAPSGVVWSPTPGDTGRSASTSLSHGGFDDDAPTMNSILRRILDLPDAAGIAAFPVTRGVSRPWTEEVDWPAEFGFSAPPAASGAAYAPPPASLPASMPGGAAAMPPYPFTPASPVSTPAIVKGSSGGRRVALCVGIDAYPAPEHQLAGCVNDARNWERILAALGFETRLLVNLDANRATLDRELNRLVDECRSGDVIVFQYAGHGTQVPDLNGDEDDATDEALCPVDFASGALYIDDDIAELFARIPDGVNMTCFMDCCHSGTNSRFAVGLSPGEMAMPPGTKARFVRMTPEIAEAHQRFRRQSRDATRALSSGGPQLMRDVKFSACLDHQVALESGGNGDFTRRATKVLAAGIQGMSNEEFLRRVLAEFGSAARQAPMLDCAEGARQGGLLQPLAADSRAPASRQVPMAAAPGDSGLLQAVNELTQAVKALAPGRR